MTAVQPTEMLAIGDLANRTGLAVSAIRYYEEIGLIPKATRRASGHRVYGSEAHELLLLIRRCRDFGFSLDDTKALTSLASSMDRDCVEARDIAQVHLNVVQVKLAELLALEQSLKSFVNACNAQCAGGPAAQCTILKDLGNAGAVRARSGGSSGAAKGCCG
jgi:DNA-binding transcriptional MerR regulator